MSSFNECLPSALVYVLCKKPSPWILINACAWEITWDLWSCRWLCSDLWLLRPWRMLKAAHCWLRTWRFCLSLPSCCLAWSAGSFTQVLLWCSHAQCWVHRSLLIPNPGFTPGKTVLHTDNTIADLVHFLSAVHHGYFCCNVVQMRWHVQSLSCAKRSVETQWAAQT